LATSPQKPAKTRSFRKRYLSLPTSYYNATITYDARVKAPVSYIAQLVI